MKEFEKELTTLINKHSIENKCDIPDFLLSSMICNYVQYVASITKEVLDWHGCNSDWKSKKQVKYNKGTQMKKYKLLIDVPEWNWRVGEILCPSEVYDDSYKSSNGQVLIKTIVENSPQVFQLIDEDEEFKKGIKRALYEVPCEDVINEITELAKKHFGGEK